MSEPRLSGAARAAVYAQDTTEVFLTLLTIDHAELATPVRVVNNTENVTSRGETFHGAPFRLDLPDEDGESLPRVPLEIDNYELEDELGEAVTIGEILESFIEPATATIEVVMASNPDVVEFGPVVMELRDTEYDDLNARGTLVMDGDLLTEPYPAGSFAPTTHPGLFKR
ncbi:MAG: DUF1833 family protein [Acetobacterales bacterium]